MSDSVLELESTLTDRYQTTVPAAVRQALQLHKRDRIRYRVMDGGQVLLERAQFFVVAADTLNGESVVVDVDLILGDFLDTSLKGGGEDFFSVFVVHDYLISVKATPLPVPVGSVVGLANLAPNPELLQG